MSLYNFILPFIKLLFCIYRKNVYYFNLQLYIKHGIIAKYVKHLQYSLSRQ